MPSSSDEKVVSVRVDEELVEEVDRAILQARANGDLPMEYSRSDAVREFFKRVAEDPSVLYEDRPSED